MISRTRTMAMSLSAALVVVACGQGGQAPETLAGHADRIAQLAADGNDCEAESLAGDLAAQVDSAEQLPAESREEVGAFLRTLVDELQCEPTPDEESEDQEDQEDDESEKDDKPGKGKGRDKGRDD